MLHYYFYCLGKENKKKRKEKKEKGNDKENNQEKNKRNIKKGEKIKGRGRGKLINGKGNRKENTSWRLNS